MNNVFIIIPAYNEEASIGFVLQKLVALYPDLKIIVVVDGANDKTADIARTFSGITVLVHEINRGQGAALETGNEYARKNNAQMVIHFDADGQFDPTDITKMIEPVLLGRADIALGSRFLGTHNTPPSRRIFLRAGILFQWFLTGLFLSDAHNGFRVLNKKALECIRLSQDRMAHATEVIEEIAKHHLRFEEVPISIQYTKEISARPHAQKSFRGVGHILIELAKERFVR